MAEETTSIRDFLKKARLNNYLDKFTKLKINTLEMARNLSEEELNIIFSINANNLSDRLTFKTLITQDKLEKVIYCEYINILTTKNMSSGCK